MNWWEALFHVAIFVFIWRVYEEVRAVKSILKGMNK